MDNLTHSLVGWALGETGLKRRSRKGLAACILAANMPDIDVFFGWFPWAPLAMHRGFTHGLVGGVLVMPPMLAGLLWLFDRWQVRQGKSFPSGLEMHFGWLVALCYLGALTHPLLDLQNTYAVQLVSPASTRWFHTDGLFIISPWILAMLGAGIAISRRAGRRLKPHAGRPALVGMLGAVAFIAVNIGISRLADAAVRLEAPYAHPDRIFAGPEPFAFWKREVIWREDGRIARGHFDPLRNVFALTDYGDPMEDRMKDPLVLKAIHASPKVRDFLDWSQLPFARIERRGCTAEVVIGDARFASGGVAKSFSVSVQLAVSGKGCPPK